MGSQHPEGIMSADRIDPHAAADSAAPTPESNGSPVLDRDALIRDIVVLRARCSNLRHWCRALLDEPASAGVLDEPTTKDLRTTAPALAEADAHDLIGQLTRGGQVPANHPLAPEVDEVRELRTAVASLTTEHKRLRDAFFALYDNLYPDDNLADEYFLAQQGEPAGMSISELIAEFEREEETKP
jgi:hypothetical protein